MESAGNGPDDAGWAWSLLEWMPTVVAASFATGAFALYNAAKSKKKLYSTAVEKKPDFIEANTRKPSTNGRVESCCGQQDNCCKSNEAAKAAPRLKILYGSQMGNSKASAEKLKMMAEKSGLQVDGGDIVSLGECDAEETLTSAAAAEGVVIAVVVSTYTDGEPPPDAAWFYTWLKEAANDFRYQHSMLKGLRYAVFGHGHSDYGKENYCLTAKKFDRHLASLSAARIAPVGMADEAGVECKAGSPEADFDDWARALIEKVKGQPSCNGGSCSDDIVRENGISETEEEDASDFSEEEASEGEGEDLVDLEDLGKINVIKAEAGAAGKKAVKAMITPNLRKNLSKQGYKLIGTHSAVKICRWTKAQLRGRGGCYKHTFYGIESHRCMEATPSLACANKCVFCWRHHTNPVGTEWKWLMDEPDKIVNDAVELHRGQINTMRGVPGVTSEKLAEGFDVRHCALSLVGEPIMYPKITSLVKHLHARKISTFLVTNAQFPDAIRDLCPVTQLYVSIDASTKESLKKIDRPLFKDFWPRFLQSLAELERKGQRTVYRLTLVKGWNAEEMDNYAKLVDVGRPDFIEVKGVTYCGTSKASTLTMENVPWHEEVLHFVLQLASRLPDYEVASEHEHSNCVLVAHKKFRDPQTGGWRTWIDYERFHQLSEAFERDSTKTFSSLDYALPTPHWAVFGSRERGFDPQMTRFHRKRKQQVNGGDG